MQLVQKNTCNYITISCLAVWEVSPLQRYFPIPAVFRSIILQSLAFAYCAARSTGLLNGAGLQFPKDILFEMAVVFLQGVEPPGVWGRYYYILLCCHRDPVWCGRSSSRVKSSCLGISCKSMFSMFRDGQLRRHVRCDSGAQAGGARLRFLTPTRTPPSAL